GESETNVHAARIRLQWLVNEIADLREACDLGKQLLGFGFRETHQRSVHENVFDAGELRIESRAQLKQRGDAAFNRYTAVCRFECAGDDLQERRFAGAVWTNDAGGGPCFDFKANVFQRPELAVRFPMATRQRLFQTVRRPIV